MSSFAKRKNLIRFDESKHVSGDSLIEEAIKLSIEEFKAFDLDKFNHFLNDEGFSLREGHKRYLPDVCKNHYLMSKNQPETQWNYILYQPSLVSILGHAFDKIKNSLRIRGAIFFTKKNENHLEVQKIKTYLEREGFIAEILNYKMRSGNHGGLAYFSKEILDHLRESSKNPFNFKKFSSQTYCRLNTVLDVIMNNPSYSDIQVLSSKDRMEQIKEIVQNLGYEEFTQNDLKHYEYFIKSSKGSLPQDQEDLEETEEEDQKMIVQPFLKSQPV